MIFLANLLRLFSFFISVKSNTEDDMQSITKYNGIANFLCSIQYFLIGAYTGGVTSLIAVLRNILFYKYKNKVPLYVMIIYFIFLILTNIPILSSIVTYLPLIMVFIYSIGLYVQNAKFMKAVIIFVGILSLIYDIYYMVIIGVVQDIINLILVLISLKKKAL